MMMLMMMTTTTTMMMMMVMIIKHVFRHDNYNAVRLMWSWAPFNLQMAHWSKYGRITLVQFDQVAEESDSAYKITI